MRDYNYMDGLVAHRFNSSNSVITRQRQRQRRLSMCRSWIGWNRSEDPEPSVLSSSIRHGPQRPQDAIRVIEEAEAAFEQHGSRAVYCESKGIHYDRSVKYLPIIEHLESSLGTDSADSDESPPRKDDDVNPSVLSVLKKDLLVPYLDVETLPAGAGPEFEGQCIFRVRIIGMTEETFTRMMKEGKCPLCGDKIYHSLAMCPIIPNELRPFC